MKRQSNELQHMASNIENLKEKVMELPLGYFESWMGCEKLKEKLWKLLSELELRLNAAEKAIREKLNSFELKQ